MDEKQALVPRLRFPEFREEGEWQERKLGEKDIASFVKKRVSRSDLRLESYISTENLLPNFGGKKRASKLPPSGSFTSFKTGDILIANIRPYLKKVWVADFYGAASNDVIVIRPMGGIRGSFLSALLKNDAFIGYVMEGAKGVKMPRGDVSLMKEYSLAVPCPGEQQKIADCLSSLDALIAAQADKIDALKIHKKGLMQLLFPRDGETVPRLRFPEFWGAGEWQYRKAGLLFSNRTEQGQDGLPIYSVTMNDGVARRDSLDRKIDNISESSGNKKAHRHDIIYNMMRMWQGASGVADEDCMVSPAYVVLAPREFVSSAFFGYLFKTHQFLHILTAHSQGLTKDRLRLYFKDFAQIPLPIPPVGEQKKIGGCLLSLDEAITVQTEKLGTLNAHKKGLMQQLFPSLGSRVDNSG
ncbi:restriction endonuclease subunit S [Marinimicrobium agarilyticum]|uniref:restriction endonuclease subunit S n=1 Tax=Marinimicrobium agarilyticum TaxID=306546 RepID=UPI0003FEDF0D|nr:restriction endonuclease subunit S [Marinimicrobium agarilyticum]